MNSSCFYKTDSCRMFTVQCEIIKKQYYGRHNMTIKNYRDLKSLVPSAYSNLKAVTHIGPLR